MTREWRVTLPTEFARRFEEGEDGTDLVLWRKGMTCWTTVYGPEPGETPAATLEWRKAGKPPHALEEFELRDSQPLRYGFLLRESSEGGQECWALHGCTFGERGHVLMAIYFDVASDLETAKEIWLSITDTPNAGRPSPGPKARG